MSVYFFQSASGASGNTLGGYSESYNYSQNDLTNYLGRIYQSLTDDNQGNTPSSSPSSWQEYNGASLFQKTFTSVTASTYFSWSASTLTVTHSLNTLMPLVVLKDNSGEIVLPPSLENITANTFDMDFTDITVSGTWTITVGAGITSGGSVLTEEQIIQLILTNS